MLAAVGAAFLAQPLCAQDDALPKAEQAKIEREEKKAAADWMKSEINTLRKTTALLKKIKNEKTVKKNLKDIQAMYGLSKAQTAMGNAGPAEKPTGAAYKEQEKKNASTLEKIRKELGKEIERVRGLELDNADLEEALTWIESSRLIDDSELGDDNDDDFTPSPQKGKHAAADDEDDE